MTPGSPGTAPRSLMGKTRWNWGPHPPPPHGRGDVPPILPPICAFAGTVGMLVHACPKTWTSRKPPLHRIKWEAGLLARQFRCCTLCFLLPECCANACLPRRPAKHGFQALFCFAICIVGLQAPCLSTGMAVSTGVPNNSPPLVQPALRHSHVSRGVVLI